MTEVDTFTPAEHLEHWRFNVALECSGASLCAIESIAVGGAVLTMASLLEALEWATAEIERAEVAIDAAREDTEKRIVEWLRAVSADYEEQERAGGMPADGAPYSAAAMEFADMLERGDHHITKGG